MTFAWETEVFTEAVNDLGMSRQQVQGLNLDSWVWAVIDDIFGGSYYLVPSGVNLPTVDIPVGSGDIPFQSTSGGLPPVSGPTILDQTPPTDQPPFRPPPPPNQTELPVTFGDYGTWDDFIAAGHTRPGDWDVYANPGDYVAGVMLPRYVAPNIPTTNVPQGGPNPPEPPAIQNGEQGMWNDLGTLGLDLLRQAGTAAIQQRFAPSQVTGGPIGTVVSAAANQTLVDVPGMDVVPQNPSTSSCGEYVYKKVCGQWKWVKKQRRRRKRLATKSDLSDLASLKGILGQGKAFEVWIATHS